MKRRLAFVRALLSDPELLLLDEPTTGLDPTVRHLIWEKVLSYREAGKTVLVTTHYMHEAELLCDRVVILNRGAVVEAGAPRELIAQHAPGYVGIFAREDEERLRPHLGSEAVLYQQGWQSLRAHAAAGNAERAANRGRRARAAIAPGQSGGRVFETDRTRPERR